jgi:DNA-binding transcriptional LysR family regulator
MRSFDPDLLQTLVAFAEAGTLARASEIVGRTPSAVTAQMQRLEELAGVPLLEAVGRRRVLTEAGERLVGHGRRILAANREAWLSVSGASLGGTLGIGLTQDFAGDALLAILNQFARTHPRLRMDLRVGRTVELGEDLLAKRIDVLIAMRRAVEADELAVIREPMQWLAASDGLIAAPNEELPLAVLDAPCSFRDAALKSLDAAGRPYRIAATSASLAGIIAAVRAGVAVTVRTPRALGAGIAIAPKMLALPPLPDAEFSIRLRDDAGALAQRLAAILAADLRPAL